MSRRFPIAELRALVARALRQGHYTPAASNRVRAVPDTRTIRYYTTLGLISPPAEMRGRSALYDERHLMQVVAIKRLQTENLSLSEIQQRLVGLPDSGLQDLAQIPADFWQATDGEVGSREDHREPLTSDAAPVPRAEDARGPSNPSPPPSPPPPRPGSQSAPRHAQPEPSRGEPLEREFWSAAPALPGPPEATAPGAVEACLKVQIAPAVELLVRLPVEHGTGEPQRGGESRRALPALPATVDYATLQRVAQPLLRELQRQGLMAEP